MTTEAPSEGGRRALLVGKYEVLERIATGGMGAVYCARDIELGRVVALKILPHDLAARPHLVERFRREARNAARLRHENVVTLYEFGEVGGTYYLAMEYVDGIDLYDHILETGRLDPEDARQIVLQAARALEHAAGQGVIHRDIKPSNFLLARQHDKPLVKLTDLGISRAVADGEETRVTIAGHTVGTVDYMAPEQARDSRAADVRSDIYSLGCTLYHMLAGRPPFEGTLTEIVFKHRDEAPADVRGFNPAVPAGLVTVLNRMMAKAPEDRYQTPAELIRDLERVDRLPPPVRADRPRRGESLKARPTTPHTLKKNVPVLPDVDELTRMDRDATTLPDPSPRQHRIALGQFQRANELLAEGDTGSDYVLRLLLSCCRLDPANLAYRQTLRRTAKLRYRTQPRSGTFDRSIGWLAKASAKAAKKAGNFAKVLEYGEQVLLRAPFDVGTQMDMAFAADELGLLSTAIWLLEEARQQDLRNVTLNRALARLHEKRRHFSTAMALWELVRKDDPTDTEAFQKTKDLAASDTIARAGYGEPVKRR